jgi:hypothetical protein
MGLVLVIPAIALEQVQSLLTGRQQLNGIMSFEDKIVCSAVAGTHMGPTLNKGGIPRNVVGFGSNNDKPMWRYSRRFDATGQAIEDQAWDVDPELRAIIYERIRMNVKNNTCGDDITWDSWKLAQYAFTLCGPDFCPNQLEYGKRYALRSLLLD